MGPAFITGAILGATAGTLGEYLMHRWMHDGVYLRGRHLRHHQLGIGQGVLGELIDYARGGALPTLGFVSLFAGPLRLPVVAGGFLAGTAGYMVFAAFSHQVQHEKPHLVFWMKKPVHTLHHERGMRHRNFGISTDLWDRVFGTYQDVPWHTTRPALRELVRELLSIDWGSPPKLDAQRRQAWEAEQLRARRERRRAERARGQPYQANDAPA